MTFYFLPNLDLTIASVFIDAGGHFFIGQTMGGIWAREIAAAAPFVILGGMIIAYLANRWGRPIGRAPTLRSLAFLILSFSLGSGVVVNLGMKDHLHRPRPIQVTEFGGPYIYRQFYQWDGGCPRHCSFPSGEASAAFWLVAPASLAPPPYRPAAVGGALVFGIITSLLRMAFGGHFLSDVIFSALITIWLVVIIHWLVFRRRVGSLN
ncbi:phosphatase PAP2 family protein [Rhizobium jaguaris]|uniref:phosphatase PAP2 family protein n=1 Tax=Rhizobium jaguaris TaxID=1312183 RepID=UPI0039BEE56B